VPDVAIVGGGPAGLAAAIELRRRGVGDVVVIEREAEPGGIPRHARHQGFGLRDLRRALSGPAYARRYAAAAREAGAELLTETMVTGWAQDGALELTGPGGRATLEPAAVVLATGCRERPRSARLVAGSRPDGVLTTATLQQRVYLQGLPAGQRALVVGAEHVSFSAIMTLAHGGARTVALTTTRARHESLAAFRLGALLRYRVPVWTRTRVTAIRGRPRVEAVELTDLVGGGTRVVECDTVVFSDDWIPDHELAALGGVELDPRTRGPAVDAAQRCSLPGVFAAGNVLHGAEQADVAALSGRHAAQAVASYLEDGEWPVQRVGLRCESPLGWVAPNALSGAEPPARGRFLLRSSEFLRLARVEVVQGERTLWSGRIRRLMPGRSAPLPWRWTRDLDPGGEPVVCRLRRSG
jgi:thioredoxin reductase